MSRWHFAFRQWNREQITENVITDSEFTLGTVASVIGMKHEYDSDGNIVGYLAGHMVQRTNSLTTQEMIFLGFPIGVELRRK